MQDVQSLRVNCGMPPTYQKIKLNSSTKSISANWTTKDPSGKVGRPNGSAISLLFKHHFFHPEVPLVEDPEGRELASGDSETALDNEDGCKPSSKVGGTDAEVSGVLATQPRSDPSHVMDVDVVPPAPSPQETPVESVPISVRMRTVLCGATEGFVVRPPGRFECRLVVGLSSDSESLSSEFERNLLYMYVTTTRRLHTVNVTVVLMFAVKPRIIALLFPNESARRTVTAYTIPAKELHIFAANSQESSLRRDRRMCTLQRNLKEMRVNTESARRSQTRLIYPIVFPTKH